MTHEHYIGKPNANGSTVLHVRPQQIRILETGVVLTLSTDMSYPLGDGHHTVRAGDYVGEEGEYVAHDWLIRHHDKWEVVG